MGKPPKIIYTDNEGALNSKSLQTKLKEQDIKHIVTRTHAKFAERFIRTFRVALYRRIENDKKNENN